LFALLLGILGIRRLDLRTSLKNLNLIISLPKIKGLDVDIKQTVPDSSKPYCIGIRTGIQKMPGEQNPRASVGLE
jgi:hypothetical protein